MKRKKKVLLCLMLLISIMLFILGTKADSGFDFDYDSGGWDSGSSWDSGGSWDSDWGSPSGGVYIGGSGGSIIALIIIAFIIYTVIKSMRQGNTSGISLNHNNELLDERIAQIIGEFNKEKFLESRFNDFVKVQEGWMNFDYDLLKTKLTDEIYNQYVMQLDTLQVKNQKNIMRDFEYLDAMITDISKDGEKVTITIELLTKFYDYIEEDGKVVRGNKDVMHTVHYEITFVTNLVAHDVCPNCGAKLPKTNVCEYCHSIVPNVGNDWIMSKKENIRQR